MSQQVAAPYVFLLALTYFRRGVLSRFEQECACSEDAPVTLSLVLDGHDTLS